ncbi:MAG: formylglycine-generating enzyme family protein, partial [bacterium]|nr:formylglycine-generating enzyme family protein [bacterium]
VTQGQWKAIMGENPSYFKNCGNECPVETVSWEDVQKFIERLNQIKGAGTYRLPTEAEWEYACRAGTTTALYSGSIEILGNRNAPALDPIAWYGGNSGVKYKGGWDSSGWSEKQYENDRSGTHPVGKKNPNAWGLYDMLGNVWEWCQDWYGEEYPSGSVIDPEGQSTGSYRVLRGGSWNYAARNVRCANRGWYSPDDRGGDAGFRVVYSPPQ